MKNRAVVKIVLCAIAAVLLVSILCTCLFAANSGAAFSFSWNIFGWGDYSDYEVGGGTVSETVRQIDIEWSGGSVTVKSYDGDTIQISETGEKDKDDALRYQVKNGELKIRERKNTWSFLSFSHTQKTLEVLIPSGRMPDGMEISVASAKVTVSDLTMAELKIDTASGDLKLSGCEVVTLDIDTASGGCNAEDVQVTDFQMDSVSGDAVLSGSFDEVKFDGVSGKLKLISDVTPRSIEVNMVSAGCDITIPADSGFRAEADSLSGSMSIVGFGTDASGSYASYGDGKAKYNFDSVSGDVIIRAGQASKTG